MSGSALFMMIVMIAIGMMVGNLIIYLIERFIPEPYNILTIAALLIIIFIVLWKGVGI